MSSRHPLDVDNADCPHDLTVRGDAGRHWCTRCGTELRRETDFGRLVGPEPQRGETITTIDVPALLAEVEHLRAQLAAVCADATRWAAITPEIHDDPELRAARSARRDAGQVILRLLDATKGGTDATA